MADDMDIEMDLDVGLLDENVQDIEILEDMESTGAVQQIQPVAYTTPNDASKSDALEPTPQKVHLRGLDNLTTKDIQSFAAEYFPAHAPSRVEWIDDTSANLVYETAEIASGALVSFSSVEIADVSQLPLMQALSAKSFPLHPHTHLEVRLAVAGDRKQAGARDRSRFYLLNPEYDRAERRKNDGRRGGNRYRDRDDGGYRSQRYDEREQRKRQNGDLDSGFDASLYDDDEATLAQRAAKSHRRETSGSSESDTRPRGPRRGRGAGPKELFPSRGDRDSGRLRDRSASPARSDDEDTKREEARIREMRQADNAATANRLKAQMIKTQLKIRGVSKELFPSKTSVSHQRSHAFDAADETADLFADRMPVPFVDGGGDRPPQISRPLHSRISAPTAEDVNSYSIRGAAKLAPASGLSIKGSASSNQGVRELFPSGGNAGKELFAEKLEGRGLRRQKAEDLFY